MGIPADYKKYIIGCTSPSSVRGKTSRKKREKKRENSCPSLQGEKFLHTKDKGEFPDDLPQMRVASGPSKSKRRRKVQQSSILKQYPGKRSQTVPNIELKRELLKETKRLPEKPAFLDFFLSFLNILGAVCLILCILVSFYHDISKVPQSRCQIKTTVQLANVTRTGTKCIDGYMYDSFTMDISGDKIFYAPENSIKWNKDGIGKKRCTIHSLIASDSFSFIESPFFFTKTKEKIGGTENFGDKLKTGDTISVNVRESKNWLIINKYKADVNVARKQYSFEGDNDFTEKDIQKLKEIVKKLCDKKKNNVLSSFEDIFSIAY